MSDRLDHLPTIVTSKQTLALGTMIGSVLVIGIWLFAGSIPDVVHGQGILMRGGSVLDVPAAADGVVKGISPMLDSDINIGDEVATIRQPELELKIELATKKRVQLVEQDRDLCEKEENNRRLSLNAWTEETTNVQQAQKDLRKQKVDIEADLDKAKREAAAKIAPRSEVQTLSNLLVQTNLTLYTSQSREIQISAERTRLDRELLEKNAARKKEIAETERTIDELERTKARTSTIVSPYHGRLLEQLVERGNLVGAKDRVVTMEPISETPGQYPLQAIVYVPPGEGKRVEVRTGGQAPMRVQISPSTVKVEEHGFVWGLVKHVSSFPSTPEGMRRVLRNDALVSNLSGQTAPIAVTVDLETDGEEDRFKWSSPSSSDLKIHGGTLCSATIIIGTRRPIDFLIPYLKKTLW